MFKKLLHWHIFAYNPLAIKDSCIFHLNTPDIISLITFHFSVYFIYHAYFLLFFIFMATILFLGFHFCFFKSFSNLLLHLIKYMTAGLLLPVTLNRKGTFYMMQCLVFFEEKKLPTLLSLKFLLYVICLVNGFYFYVIVI